MGGIDVKIPPDLPVVYEGSAVLGGVTFLNQDDGGVIASRKVEHNIKSGDTRLLRIQARAILGGIDVKEK
jgi:predicted membrane protein